MVKACVFDLGNTITDDSRMMRETLKELAAWLKEKQIINDEEAFIGAYRNFNRVLHRPSWSHTFGEIELFERTLEALGIERVSAEETLDKYRQMLVRRVKPDQDINEAFRFLKEKGVKVALLSNERADRVNLSVRKMKIAEFLDAVVVSEEIGVEKPDPLIFEEVKDRLGVGFSDMVIFGDSEAADGGGKRMGMKFVLVDAYKDPEWDWSGGVKIEPDYTISRITKESIEKCLEILES